MMSLSKELNRGEKVNQEFPTGRSLHAVTILDSLSK